MNKKTLVMIFTLLLSFPSYSHHTGCKLKKSQVLKIGCTKNCGRFNTWALKWYAKKLGYKIKLVDLYNKRQSISYVDVDGVLIPGGVDIDPKWYKNHVGPELRSHIESIEHLVNYTEEGKRRDSFEFDLLNKYFQNKSQNKQPILGICRGMQVLTVSQKIPLIVDIKKEIGIKNRRYTLDKIYTTKKDSILRNSVRRSSFRAVELHHQALRLDYFNKYKERWPHLEVTSVSNRGRIPESLEFKNRPILGVQFHPEYTFGRVRRGIFSWLLNKACVNKKSKLNTYKR